MSELVKSTENDLLLAEIMNKEFSKCLENILQLIASQKQHSTNLVEYEEKKNKILHLIEKDMNGIFGEQVITLQHCRWNGDRSNALR